jgi:hypothetical protein
MSRIYLRFCIAIVCAGGLIAGAARLQAQESASSQSVAEAAARAKEAKKKSSGKSKVLTEDDLAAKARKAGEQSPLSASAESGATPAAATGGAEVAKERSPADTKKEDDPEVVQLKTRLADAEQDLDLAKREAALANDSYYSNPDHVRDAAGKNKLEALQQQAADKQRIVQELKDKLAALGVKPASASPAPPPSPRG